ncbi:MAG: hypothetical protein ABEJ28_10540 [Salinigranum sp.]
MESNVSEGEGRGSVRRTVDPTSTLGVDLVSGIAIETAPFDAGAVADGSVSYRMLVDAGVHPDVADDLRRTWSLVWSFRWRPGADLSRRAARLRGLSEAERAWIAESDPGDGTASDPPETVWAERRRWTERAAPEEASEGGERACVRCGSTVATYSLNGREVVVCESCGFSGLSADHRPEPRSRDESWEEAVREFVGER